MTKRRDISGQVTFASIDVKTGKLNDRIAKLLASGKRVHVTVSGYFQGSGGIGNWDGVSREHAMDVVRATMKPVAKARATK